MKDPFSFCIYIIRLVTSLIKWNQLVWKFPSITSWILRLFINNNNILVLSSIPLSFLTSKESSYWQTRNLPEITNYSQEQILTLLQHPLASRSSSFCTLTSSTSMFLASFCCDSRRLNVKMQAVTMATTANNNDAVTNNTTPEGHTTELLSFLWLGTLLFRSIRSIVCSVLLSILKILTRTLARLHGCTEWLLTVVYDHGTATVIRAYLPLPWIWSMICMQHWSLIIVIKA